MSIPFSGTFSRSKGIYSAIGKQLKLVNLKPVKKIGFKFDPFTHDVKSIRQCMSLFSAEKILSTNNQCTVKTEVVDNVEPTITLNLAEGKEIVFKTKNLNTLEFLQQFNKIIVPLVPKEEDATVATGKVAGKLAGKGAGAAGGKPKPAGKQAAKKK